MFVRVAQSPAARDRRNSSLGVNLTSDLSAANSANSSSPRQQPSPQRGSSVRVQLHLVQTLADKLKIKLSRAVLQKIAAQVGGWGGEVR